MRLLEIEIPHQAIIFCNTKVRVNYVTTVLQRFGFNAAELSSELSQAAREKVLSQLKDGSLNFLVATDVAARGIDIPDLELVILYEPPEEAELYIHRAGRTGGSDQSSCPAAARRQPPTGQPQARRRAAGRPKTVNKKRATAKRQEPVLNLEQ